MLFTFPTESLEILIGVHAVEDLDPLKLVRDEDSVKNVSIMFVSSVGLMMKAMFLLIMRHVGLTAKPKLLLRSNLMALQFHERFLLHNNFRYGLSTRGP